ncbi:hypothetical protein [Streptomyces lonarensis]|uniref:Uncharacterized protein n=1 Tax=Streptomyces lonarensis TaxID=700599 RepID=A0A7X6HXG1_9ACTN|nr:hypothetical protein [Streptomyces lonarensis]NJQ04511.1 hypothetical protein [Streptomyces lonarensis]
MRLLMCGVGFRADLASHRLGSDKLRGIAAALSSWPVLPLAAGLFPVLVDGMTAG